MPDSAPKLSITVLIVTALSFVVSLAINDFFKALIKRISFAARACPEGKCPDVPAEYEWDQVAGGAVYATFATCFVIACFKIYNAAIRKSTLN